MQVSETISVRDLAEYLKCSPSMIYNLVQLKKIPHIKIGSKIRFDKEKVNEWIKQNSFENQ
jgi:excisionase family DNA binding protein